MSHSASSEPAHPLSLHAPGHVGLLLGNEAIVRGAIEAGVGFASGYPGTPSSEVTDTFAQLAKRTGLVFEYSVNEKIALEMAFAASLAGARAITAMKHLGLMVAGDPLSTIPYVGVRGGMVVVSAGDPGCNTSPNEQDQRWLGPMLHLPILDPATPQDALEMTRLAFDLSERSMLPVLLRITTRVAHTRAAVRFGVLGKREVRGFERDPRRLVPVPAHARLLRLEIPKRLAIAQDFVEGLVRVEGDGPNLILAAGAPAATCGDLLQEAGLADQVMLATLGGVHPLPEQALLRLIARADTVLVVEELSPFLEDAVTALAARNGVRVAVLGKRSGHLPEPFEYTPEILERALSKAFGFGFRRVAVAEPAPVSAALPSRPPVLCAGCPHRASYHAARAAFPDGQLYFSDIGCYTLGFGPPLDTADALLCMGAGFTLAAGVARTTGQRTVGFLGDSTFFHSGLPALLNAVKEDVNMVAVVLDNGVTAMTGFQESPAAELEDGKIARRASIAEVARALGAKHVETVDPLTDLAGAILAFERARDAKGVSVIVCEHPCPIWESHVTRAQSAPAYRVDPDRCATCGRGSCGMRCELSVSQGHERHMARSRALEARGRDEPASAWPEPVAPCATHCPLGLCVQGYAGHIAAGQYAQALELIMSRLPLPDSVCRVCHKPCEDVCVRAAQDGPVAINDLKRFVMDWAATQASTTYAPPMEPDHGRRVAIVGAGPAGLAAAHDLRRRGYEVTIFDAEAEPGGLLRYGIPRFRLPPEVLQRDVDRVLALGVTFHGNRTLGKDVDLAGLLDAHAAVFLAVGAQAPVRLDLESQPGAPPAIDALAYLEQARIGACTPARRVVVIGGGNAAVDAARVARRFGGEQVVIAYRRGREQMPAIATEILAAVEEGIELRTHVQAVALVSGGVQLARTEAGSPDASGRPRPQVTEGIADTLAADLVIAATGQSPVLDGLDLARTGSGALRVDGSTAATSHPRLFAGGDLAGGARTVTEAIAWGLRAAWGIDRSLRGTAAADRRPPPPRTGAWPYPATRRVHFHRADHVARREPPHLAPAERVTGFAEVAGTLTEAQARSEAARCSACGMCGNCRSCIDLFGCPAFHLVDGRVAIDAALCNGCGACVAFCPNGAIRPAESEA
ncbi:MAG: FAD-dependent oxidoreductase [Planctomycetes bacterium]|nr:FAD-dependent oxidoreductase [Planctomycetota bacterium]